MQPKTTQQSMLIFFELNKSFYGHLVWKSLYEHFVWKSLYGHFVWKSLYEHFVWKSLYDRSVTQRDRGAWQRDIISGLRWEYVRPWKASPGLETIENERSSLWNVHKHMFWLHPSTNIYFYFAWHRAWQNLSQSVPAGRPDTAAERSSSKGQPSVAIKSKVLKCVATRGE